MCDRYLDEIRKWEKISRSLEPESGQRRVLADRAFRYAERFLETIDSTPAFRSSMKESSALKDDPISEAPSSIESLLNQIREQVDGPGLNPASGGDLGYIPGGGIYPSALGDYLAAVTNRYAGIAFASPGAAGMERMLIRWMASLIGFPESAGGDLTSGGSIANLVGVVSAREAHGIQAKDFHRAVVYLTRHTHHSVEKALRIAGMTECVKREIEVDNSHRMEVAALRESVDRDAKARLIPWMIVASAGTTDTGSVDPLGPIAELAGERNLWLHIDAAYGGFFILCREGSRILSGIDAGDSIVMDPHKGLFLPYGSGAVLVRDSERLREAHLYRARYMQDVGEVSDEYSPADHSPELSRHFRGLRFWLPLKLFGVAAFRACLEEKLLLARYFYERIRKVNGFEVGPFPELSVVVCRYLPPTGDPNEFNRKLAKEIQKDGRVFLSSTTLEGKFVLRLAILGFRTHLDTIDLALELLQKKARYLVESS